MTRAEFTGTCHQLIDFISFHSIYLTYFDTVKEPQEYRMTVHIFRATSSPGCANFALKTTADDHEAEFGMAAANFPGNELYVDDGKKSIGTVKGSETG